MENGPDFIEFATIQIFAALITDPRRTDAFEVDASEAWRLAKVLYDAKPKQTI
jgi:hypothetical protein